MNHSESFETLAEALAKAQLAFLPVKQSEKVDYATASGRKKYSYAPLSAVLDACRKALSDNGLAIIQMPANDNEKIIIETVLLHKSGQWVSSVLGLKPVNYDPQSIGSLITYLRRYSLSSMLGIASEEDDDASGAKSAVEEKHKILPDASKSAQDTQETARKTESRQVPTQSGQESGQPPHREESAREIGDASHFKTLGDLLTACAKIRTGAFPKGVSRQVALNIWAIKEEDLSRLNLEDAWQKVRDHVEMTN